VAAPDEPFTIIRAAYNDDGKWEVHQFTLLPDSGPPASIPPIPNAEGLKCSIIDYVLFRARYMMKFEGGLREGLAIEFTERDRIKRASYIATYLFCSPLWPLHILWELPLAGVEKERMLDKEGITIILPSTEPGGIGEIPCRVDEAHILHFDEPGVEDIHPSGSGWQGAGLLQSYTVDLEVSPPEMFPGWPMSSTGTILLLINAPSGKGFDIDLVHSPDNRVIADLWPGRYEWALGWVVYVFNGGGPLLGYRRIKVRTTEDLHVRAIQSSHSREFDKSGGIRFLRNTWPGKGRIIRQYPWVMYIIGIVICFMVFHIINILLLRIKYSGAFSGALYDPLISHICILVFATIFLPLFGLGWIAGAYLAGCYLHWRHPGAKYTWWAMLAYVMVTTAIFELIFANPLWV